jgi:hypothetical protein
MTRALIAFCILFALTACESENNPNPQNSTETINNSLTVAGGLRISEFIEEGRDKTSIFSPYRFLFNSDGTVIASKTGTSISGTYRVFRDDGRVELRMDFPNNSELYELTDDWYFISQSANVIRFEDSGDTIVFQQQ